MVKESKQFLRSGKSVYLALNEPGEFDEILTFYERHLSAGWQRRPSNDIDWPSASGLFPARHALWFNLESHRFSSVSTVDVVTEDVIEEFGESELIAHPEIDNCFRPEPLLVADSRAGVPQDTHRSRHKLGVTLMKSPVGS